MNRISSALVFSQLVALTALVAPTPAGAQIISLKTVPLAAGDQFLVFPDHNLGMGGVSIALDDPFADPFGNPATASRDEVSRFFTVPTFYGVSNDNGGARTMPVGLHLQGGRWFGGGVVAIQDLSMGRALRNWVLPLVEGDWSLPSANALVNRSVTNRFAQFSLGRRIGSRWAVAGSVMLVGLNGTDGVEQLFANAWDIEESGTMRDVRVGVAGSLDDGSTLEVALVRSRYELTHDVTSVAWELVDTASWLWEPEVSEEGHRNIGRTWGAHVRYVRPLKAEGWRVGGIVTVNRKDHPKIPTYDLTAVEIAVRAPIPRDPGNSWAFNIGAGISYEEGPTTFAMDVVYEPAVSDTWADEVEDVVAADGSVIPAGGHTVDNHFDFANAHAGAGLRHRLRERWALQLGIRMKSYSYSMEQQDYVLGLDRSLTQQWTQWTPTWGFSYDLNGIDLRYTGMASSASHFPFPDFGWSVEDDIAVAPDGPDLLAPPGGRLGTPDETVVTHRFQVSVPIR